MSQIMIDVKFDSKNWQQNLWTQINTEQMKQQLGCLDVNVPPDIDYLQVHQDGGGDKDGE